MTLRREECFGIIPVRGACIFLVQHAHGGHWAFPKGKAQTGESPRDAACRELKEETGLVVRTFLQETPFVERYTFLRAGERIDKTVHYFLAEVEGDPVLQQEEIVSGKWVLWDEVGTWLTFFEAKVLYDHVRRVIGT